jgi:hypothetical protein
MIHNWPSARTSAFGHVPLCFNHRLGDTGLFSRSALARLIDSYPADRYNLVKMGAPGSSKKTWQYGKLGRMSGYDVIDAIASQRLWINLLHVNEVSKDYQYLLDGIFKEFHAILPALPCTFKRICGILISSPGAQVYYHFDTAAQSLWQISGSKTVWIYPALQPYLVPEELEAVTLRHDETAIRYASWYDEGAKMIDLAPGDAVTWPLNAPHRVENDNELSISLTVEYQTDEIQRRIRALSGNALLGTVGIHPRNITTSGPGYYARAGIFAAAKTAGLVDRLQKRATAPSFLLSDLYSI